MSDPAALYVAHAARARLSDDLARGRTVPAGVADRIRGLINPTAELGRENTPREIIEETVKQYADRTGYSPRRIRYLCQTGQLDAHRDGWEWRIRSTRANQQADPGRRADPRPVESPPSSR